MSIDFAAERWDKIRQDARQWWAGELERPLIQAEVVGAEPATPEPKRENVSSADLYDASIPAEEIVESWDWDLSGRKFLGDAFPNLHPNLGPGAAAALMGARPEVRPETVWFHPPAPTACEDLHLHYDPDSPLARRLKDLYRAAVDRWAGGVQIAMTDLGGNLDVVSTFLPGEELVMDLYDCPDEVRRVTWEAHKAWHEIFDDLNRVLRPANPGYTAWAPIFSETPYYILQCDFCYMIGPEMFDRFVKPELAATCKRLGNSFYHLDGVGQLPHLDSLLEIDELGGVQWVHGEGQPPIWEWPEVHRKIHAAGKRIQFFAWGVDGARRCIDAIAEQIGTARGICAIVTVPAEQEDDALRMLERYGVV